MAEEIDIKEKIRLIRSLFKGREDVFAVRWEKFSAASCMTIPMFKRDILYGKVVWRNGFFKKFEG